MSKHDAAVHAPAIQGPARAAPSDPAPVFDVMPGEGRYFAVEIATEPYLFDRLDHEQERDEHNFYASWTSGLQSGTAYRLPVSAWTRLREADRLYYRLLTSTRPDRWADFEASTPDAEAYAAPWIQIERTTLPEERTPATRTVAARPTITGPEFHDPAGPPPRLTVDPGGRRFFAVEVATAAALFDRAAHEAERTPDNFFASWEHGLLPAGGPTAYELPRTAWGRLRRANRLYYRVLTAEAPEPGWPGFAASVTDADAASAPYITLKQATTEARGDIAHEDDTRHGERHPDRAAAEQEPVPAAPPAGVPAPESPATKQAEAEEPFLPADEKAFEAALEHALQHWNRLPHLRRSPLTRLHLVRQRARANATANEHAEILRGLLRDTMEELQPSKLPRYVARALDLTYFDPAPKADTAAARAALLGVSTRTYYRYLKRGRAALARALYEREQRIR